MASRGTARTGRTRRRRWAAASATVAALTVAMAGCSDDTPSSSPTAASTRPVSTPVSGSTVPSSSLTATEFQARANAACSQGSARIDTAAQAALGSTDGPPDEQAIAEYLHVLASATRDRIGAIAAIEPPDELAEQVADLLATAEDEYAALVGAIEDDPVGFAENDTDPFAGTNALAAELGLDACAAA